MKENKDSFNSFKLKNNSLLSRFLNDKKSRIRCKFGQLANKLAQTCRDLLGSFYLIFHLKFRMQVHLFFTYLNYLTHLFFFYLNLKRIILFVNRNFLKYHFLIIKVM